MKSSYLKLIFFTFFLLLFCGIIKIIAYYKITNDESFNLYNRILPGLNCYFIGSSRIRYAIDENILKSKIPNVNFFNLGISSLPLNYNIVLANKLIASNKNTLIFIELSRMRLLKFHHLYLYDLKDILSGLKMLVYYNPISSLNDLMKYIKEIEASILSFFAIQTDLKIIFDPKLVETQLGYVKSEVVYSGKINLFLKDDDLIKTSEVSKLNPGYLDVLNTLIKEGENKHSKIIFLLPLCIDREAAEELLPLFHAIPFENKMIYSRAFLSKIRNVQNTYDGFHLNSKGTELYTPELLEEVKRQILQNE